MKMSVWLGAGAVISAFLAVASITYQDTVRSHDDALFRAKGGFIGCEDGHAVVRNITFGYGNARPYFAFDDSTCLK